MHPSDPRDPSDPTRPANAPPGTWAPARRAARAIATPIQNILAVEAASGLILLATTLLALLWANSAWSDRYSQLWHVSLGFQIADWSFVRPLEFWINDGLMTVFFFVVGLEIRREIFEGELASLRGAALPFAAALGGMAMPALIFIGLNVGREGAGGWAVPMATDIAFAVGVLTLLGSRVPAALRILLLTLAVIDDIGAIIVIAIVYNSGIEPVGFAIAAAGIGVAIAMRSAAIRQPLAYLVPGITLWAGLYILGVHPTLAGVILGLLTPVRSWFGAAGFSAATHVHLAELDSAEPDRAQLFERLDAIEQARREAVSPTERLIHALHPWVAYVVMPVFALANAGVTLGGADLSGDRWWLFLGIVVGLAVGKPLGIVAASLAASRLGLATRTAETNLSGLTLVGLVGGIGFTMSLFIAQLAFKPGPMLDTAKLAILVGSAVAIAVGLGFGLVTRRRPVAVPEAAGEARDEN